MSFFKILIKKFSYFLFLLTFLISCQKVDPTTGEKILIEPDPNKKARQFADKSGGIFGNINNANKGGNFEFSTSNVLWRATLKNLEFLPLVNVDYSGGVIIYDWYSREDDSKEQIKISIRFVSNDLRTESIIVTAHKRICETAGQCKNLSVDKKFSSEIKDSIVTSARLLKIEDAKKEIK
jgi:hypothetical protein